MTAQRRQPCSTQETPGETWKPFWVLSVTWAPPDLSETLLGAETTGGSLTGVTLSSSPSGQTLPAFGCLSIEKRVHRLTRHNTTPYKTVPPLVRICSLCVLLVCLASFCASIASGYDAYLNYNIFPAMSEFISGGYSRGVVELKAGLEHSAGAVHANSTCVLHTMFNIGNPNGTNTTVMKWVIEPVDDNSNSPTPKKSHVLKYDQRFPGNGWQWISGTDAWERVNHTMFSEFMGSPLKYGNSTVRDFVMDRITNGKLTDRTGIVEAWKNDRSTSNTSGGQTLNKLYFEAFGNLFESWMHHYLKVHIRELRGGGMITKRPNNIPVDVWESMVPHPQATESTAFVTAIW